MVDVLPPTMRELLCHGKISQAGLYQLTLFSAYAIPSQCDHRVQTWHQSSCCIVLTTWCLVTATHSNNNSQGNATVQLSSFFLMEFVILIAFDLCTDKTTNKIDTIHVDKDPPRSLLKYSYRAHRSHTPPPSKLCSRPRFAQYDKPNFNMHPF